MGGARGRTAAGGAREVGRSVLVRARTSEREGANVLRIAGAGTAPAVTESVVGASKSPCTSTTPWPWWCWWLT